MVRRVLLTGASGFVGGHLTRRLLADGWQVTALCRRQSVTFQAEGLSWRAAEDGLEAALQPLPDAILHTATCYGRQAETQVAVQAANTLLPKHLYTLGRDAGVPRFINTESFFNKWPGSAGYQLPYAAAKRRFTDSLRDSPGQVTLSLEHVYGPGDGPGKFIPWVIDQALAGQTLALTAGYQRRDFIHVRDVVDAYVTLLESDVWPAGDFEVGWGTSIPVRDCVTQIVALAGGSPQFGAVPMPLNEIADSCADNCSLMALGWTPQITLAEGLADCVQAARQASAA